MNQHWVDRAYLEAWCDPSCPEGWEPFVWLFDATTRKGKRRAPKNIFKEPHMYTMPEGSTGDPLSLEKSLQKLCDEFLRVRNEKVLYRRLLDGQDRAWLGMFAAAKFSRTPKNRAHTRSTWGHMADVVEDLARAHGKDSSGEIPVFMKGFKGTEMRTSLRRLREIEAHPLQRMLVPAVFGMSDHLARMPLLVLHNAGSPGFVTSDAPVVLFNPTARMPGLGHPDTEVTLPLSPHHMAIWTRQFAADRNGYYIDVDSDMVDILNRRTLYFCDKEFVAQADSVRDEWFAKRETEA
jgi:hypothetical protein